MDVGAPVMKPKKNDVLHYYYCWERDERAIAPRDHHPLLLLAIATTKSLSHPIFHCANLLSSRQGPAP